MQGSIKKRAYFFVLALVLFFGLFLTPIEMREGFYSWFPSLILGMAIAWMLMIIAWAIFLGLCILVLGVIVAFVYVIMTNKWLKKSEIQGRLKMKFLLAKILWGLLFFDIVVVFPLIMIFDDTIDSYFPVIMSSTRLVQVSFLIFAFGGPIVLFWHWSLRLHAVDRYKRLEVWIEERIGAIDSKMTEAMMIEKLEDLYEKEEKRLRGKKSRLSGFRGYIDHSAYRDLLRDRRR